MTVLQQLYISYQHHINRGDFNEIAVQMKETNIPDTHTDFLLGMLRYSFKCRWFIHDTWQWFLHEVDVELRKRGEPASTLLAGLKGTTEKGRMTEWPKGAINNIQLVLK
jgi:hypothetical protein